MENIRARLAYRVSGLAMLDAFTRKGMRVGMHPYEVGNAGLIFLVGLSLYPDVPPRGVLTEVVRTDIGVSSMTAISTFAILLSSIHVLLLCLIWTAAVNSPYLGARQIFTVTTAGLWMGLAVVLYPESEIGTLTFSWLAIQAIISFRWIAIVRRANGAGFAK